MGECEGKSGDEAGAKAHSLAPGGDPCLFLYLEEETSGMSTKPSK